MRLIVNSFVILFLLSSCSKGYEARVINLNLEKLDSVIVGKNVLVFTDVDLQQKTDYQNLKSGTYTLQFVTKSKKRYSTEFTIPSKGKGKRSLQVDAINNISIIVEK